MSLISICNTNTDLTTDEFNPPSNLFRDVQSKWNGWGYSHSSFCLCPTEGHVLMTSEHYKELDGKPLPALRPWIEKNLGVDMNYRTPSVDLHSLCIPPPAVRNLPFMDFLQKNKISFSNSPLARLVRSHGQTLAEIMDLRNGRISRIPDLIVWPRNEKQIERILIGANEFGVLIIPIGGGTSVSQALQCPLNMENKCICSLDMSLMNRLLNVNESDMTATAEAGILGQTLEAELNKRGFTCGHEPDSMEFSTLGGWISTRASGMKKNKYGNIEDLLLSARLYTSNGILQPRQLGQVPRVSAGPDLLHILLGSEGQLGVISQATIKVFRYPDRRCFGAILFPSFENGVEFFREVALRKWQPASLRLVDNTQFQMGQAMRTQSTLWHSMSVQIARLYLTRWKGFKADQMVAATCVFEGSPQEVESERTRLFGIASRFGGIRAPDENGQFGYRLTFAIAYLRDLSMEYSVIGESFETAIPWSRLLNLCQNVKMVLVKEASRLGISLPLLATCRVTQVYDSGACVYFYFAFNYRGIEPQQAVHIYEQIESAARNEVLACGGSISHHHGVGKIRKRWLPASIGPLGISMLQTFKHKLDPNGVFSSGNLVDNSETEENGGRSKL